GEQSLRDGLGQASAELASLSGIDPRLDETRELIDGATVQLEEAAANLRHYLDGLEMDPGRLGVVEQRIGQIHDLARKYRVAPEQLIDFTAERHAEVDRLEQAVIAVLAEHAVNARRRAGMPGVYIGDDRIASIGLKVRRGCCYHGLALNVAMDLAPFAMINPCGYAGLQMTQLSDWVPELGLEQAGVEMVSALCRLLDYHPVWSDFFRKEN
ncbi:MAG: lipoyl(octanoyl) transferase LipB, partial [Wenzhouxiangella sp.]